MNGPGKEAAAGAASLGLSLSLAALLLLMTTAPDDARKPPPQETAPAAEPARPPSDAVVLPPPPAATPAPQPSPEPSPMPDDPAVPPAAAQTPAAEPAPAAGERPSETRERPPQPLTETVAVTPETVREGRALLRLMEAGEGPDIEIAWPAAATDRTRLYRLFNACFAMRTVVLGGAGRMFAADGAPGAPWRFDGDRYSGFVRRPAGGVSADERARVDAIRRRHGLAGGQVLHLFPRGVDAILLGALHDIAGAAFAGGGRIRARYDIAPDGVRITDIRLDGRRLPDAIVLPYRAGRGCRAALRAR